MQASGTYQGLACPKGEYEEKNVFAPCLRDRMALTLRSDPLKWRCFYSEINHRLVDYLEPCFYTSDELLWGQSDEAL